jgi:putative NADH-flavin reductase
MKLIIFGSTGGTGLQLLKQALERGDEVTAFARDPGKIGQRHKNLHILAGDVLDSGAVDSAVRGQDAVLCSLGVKNVLDKSMLRVRGTRNIIHAMEAANIKRLVCQSAFGAGNSYKAMPFVYRYFLAPFVMRNLYRDHNLQEMYIKQSSLDWVVVRPGILTDDPPVGVYKHGFGVDDKTVKARVSRADVAGFMLKQVTDDQYLHEMPCLSY